MWSVNGTWIGGRAGDLDLRRVQLKTAPPEDHLVARRGGDLNELLAQADRTATDGDVLGSEIRTEVFGQRRLELHAAVVGVAVDDVGGSLDGRAHAGQRAEDGFVAGQFDGARHRLTRNINWQPGQLRP